jgi:hypothetical protein
MTNHITGELLTASVDERTLTYRLLPFGENNPGYTNLGKVIASKGAINFANAIGRSINIEHDAKRPVGKFTHIEETDEGLIATVRIAATTEGNDALVLASEGLRTGISVELTSPVIRAGHIVSGTLDAAGLVTKPAFASAQLLASDFGDLDAALDQLEEAVTATRAALNQDEQPTDSPEQEAPGVQASHSEAPDNNESETVMSENAAVPTALNAAGNSGASPVLNAENLAIALKNRDTHLMASMEDNNPSLFAALGQVTNTAHTGNVEQSQWLGELWSGQPYERKYVNLVNNAALTSYTVQGWRFVTKPAVGDYAGDLAEIPTNTPTTEAYSVEADRIAGGWKIDRKFYDFGNTEFLNSYFRAAAEDYARKSDAKVLAAIVANATALTGVVVPAGVSSAAARIVAGALEVSESGSAPAFILIGKSALKEYLNVTEFDNLKFITQTLGFTGGNVNGIPVIYAPELGANDVYVGTKDALTFLELPGTPLRVEALDVSRGGIDSALFGYYAIVSNNTAGLVKVTAAA